MAKLIVKLHDTWPPVESVLRGTNAEGQKVPIDLTKAEKVWFIMKKQTGGTAIKKLCTFPAPTTGNVIYRWATGDTGTVGLYNLEYEIVWKNEAPFGAEAFQTVPSGAGSPTEANFDEVEIVEDLG
jgi:hypothetical protein